VLGESVFRFEEEFARYCGADYAVSTGSETSALQLSLLALGIREVIRLLRRRPPLLQPQMLLCM